MPIYESTGAGMKQVTCALPGGPAEPLKGPAPIAFPFDVMRPRADRPLCGFDEYDALSALASRPEPPHSIGAGGTGGTRVTGATGDSSSLSARVSMQFRDHMIRLFQPIGVPGLDKPKFLNSL